MKNTKTKKEKRAENMEDAMEMISQVQDMAKNNHGVYKHGAVVFLAGKRVKDDKGDFLTQGVITGRGKELLHLLCSVMRDDNSFRELVKRALSITDKQNPMEGFLELLKDSLKEN